MATVQITDANAATFFIRAALGRYALTGFGGWMSDSNEQRVQRANKLAQRLGAQPSAELMRSYKGKKSGLQFTGVRCDCCGTPLTNADSVAAGRGPKCLMDGVAPPAAVRSGEPT